MIFVEVGADYAIRGEETSEESRGGVDATFKIFLYFCADCV